jgi:hypothetical protein
MSDNLSEVSKQARLQKAYERISGLTSDLHVLQDDWGFIVGPLVMVPAFDLQAMIEALVEDGKVTTLGANKARKA